MKSKLNRFSELFAVNQDSIIDKSQPYYALLINQLPNELELYFPNPFYKIKGSVGQGNVTQHPWIFISNINVTQSAKEGIYIAFLFRSDMKGFYLALNQGIEFFKGKYGKEKYAYAEKAAKLFASKITSTTFTSEPIDLVSKSGQWGYGYERTTIISKYFEKDNYSEEDLISSLKELKLIYDEVVESLNGRSYSNYIQEDILTTNYIPELFTIEKAEKVIEQAMIELSATSEGKITTFTQIDIPTRGESKLNTSKNVVPFRKIDYLKQAQSNMELGLSGEELVLEYEKEKLHKAGRPDLAAMIKWSSKDSDALGYDIQSFMVDENGLVKEIHIEVKTTSGTSKNLFYISANEIKVFEEMKDSYYIYRVCVNKKKESSEFFVLTYDDFIANFDITPTAFEVTLKPTTPPQT